MLRSIFLCLAASALAGCDDRAKEWTGWAYPDRNDLTKSESLSGFKLRGDNYDGRLSGNYDGR